MRSIKLKYSFLFLQFLAINIAVAQGTFTKALLKDFKETSNDSLFISRHSDYPYILDTYSFTYVADTTNQLYKDIYRAEISSVIGPYQTDSTEYYVKVLKIDSGYKARVGNIWIDRTRPEPLELANHILAEVQSGKDYNLFCIMYSDDKNKHQDCDLQWFYTDIMVQPFGDEVIKHKKGDVYIVETKFGYHVVKSLENPTRDRQLIHFVCLTRKK